MRCFTILLFCFPLILKAHFPPIYECVKRDLCKCKAHRLNTQEMQQVIDSLNALNTNDIQFKACSYHHIGVYYQTVKDDDLEAIKWHEKAASNRKKINSPLLWKSYRNIGLAYKELGYLERGLEYLRLADATEGTKTANDLSVIYRRIGEIYAHMGEFEQAIAYGESATKITSARDSRRAHAHNSLCNTLVQTRDSLRLIRAIDEGQKAIELYEKTKNPAWYIPMVYINIGNAFGWLGQHEKALESYREALTINPKNMLDTKSWALNNMATSYTALGQYDTAIDTLNISLQTKRAWHEQEFYPDYAGNYENLGENYQYKGNREEALRQFQNALIHLTNNFRETNISENPTVKKNEFIYSKTDIIRVLDLKAKAAFQSYQFNSDSKYLNLAFDTYNVLDEWISQFYRDLITDASKLDWIARSHQIYAHAIEVALEAEQPERAFHFAERARAVLLWQSLSEQSARTILDKNDLEKEDQLTIDIRRNEIAYFDATAREKDSLNTVIQHLNREKERLVKSFEKKYPEYFNRKYDADFITLNEVQQKIINPRTALIEYFLTDKLLYIFTINKENIHVDKIALNADFQNRINAFNQAVKDPTSTVVQFAPSAYELYEIILAPALRHLNNNTEKLILIPDGSLNYVVFEALLTASANDRNFQTLPYLIDDFRVNYLYSCNSAYSLQGVNQADNTSRFLGVAPAFGANYGTPDLSNLPDNQEEVDTIKMLYKGDVLTGKNATRAAFLNTATTTDILHIASHATQGEGEGEIYLYGGDVVTQKDIQAQQWAAKQVILSACETGLGELNRGEGVLSLGWSFAYKGVASIVMSQWAVTSSSTSHLMVDFHRKMNEKHAPDAALRMAKLDFRKGVENMYEAHPHHWAAFIHVGNVSTDSSRGSWILWGILAATFLLIMRFFKII